jgi:hypothetical protein
MKYFLLCFLFISILSCNSNPTKVGEKEKSISANEPKIVRDFLVYDIAVDALKIIPYEYDKRDSNICYTISGKIKNTSDKTFVKAAFAGELRVNFPNKKIIEENDMLHMYINGQGYMNDKDFYDIGLKPYITDGNWNPNETLNFTFQTNGLDKIYGNYMPDEVYYVLEVKAEDPVGYVFSGRVFQKDLKYQWKFKK